jgi:predicted RNase H-like HicB family nuclease
LASRSLHCYAEGRNGDWEAICLDLDIAVQGGSFEEVFGSLREAISLYLESVADL